MDGFVFMDTHREKSPSNESPTFTENMNLDIWLVNTSNQLFIRAY